MDSFIVGGMCSLRFYKKTETPRRHKIIKQHSWEFGPSEKGIKKKQTKTSERQASSQRLFSKSFLDSLRSNDKSRSFAMKMSGDPTIFDSMEHVSVQDTYDEYDEELDDVDDNEDDDDEGTIHPYGPGVDAKQLLTALTSERGKDIGSFSINAPSYNLTRTHSDTIDRKGGPLAPLPGPPRDVTAQIVKPRFVTLNWLEPYKNADEITSYSVYYKLSTSER